MGFSYWALVSLGTCNGTFGLLDFHIWLLDIGHTVIGFML